MSSNKKRDLRYFLFTIRENDTAREIQIQAAGGPLRVCSDRPHSQKYWTEATKQTLRAAQFELERHGCLREWKDVEEYKDRITVIHPDEVTACRPVFNQ